MYEEEIARGAELLDNHFNGKDWRQRINLETLDMGSSFSCVLGQLFGGFWYATTLLALSPQDTRSKGFLAHPRFAYDYPALTNAWKKFLQENPVK